MSKPVIASFGSPPPDIQRLRIEALHRQIALAKEELDNLATKIDIHLSKTALYRIEGRMSTLMTTIMSVKMKLPQ